MILLLIHKSYLAKKENKEVILNPYLYTAGDKEILITSLVVPIHFEGEFVGVAGVDVTMESIQKVVEQVRPYEDGYGFSSKKNCSYILFNLLFGRHCTGILRSFILFKLV